MIPFCIAIVLIVAMICYTVLTLHRDGLKEELETERRNTEYFRGRCGGLSKELYDILYQPKSTKEKVKAIQELYDGIDFNRK